MVRLPEAKVSVRADGRVEVQLFELTIPLDAAERDRWSKVSCQVANSASAKEHQGIACVPSNAEVVDPILDDLECEGLVLNMSRSTFYHQPAYHYCEIQVARRLKHDWGFQASEILYENWRISARSRALAGKQSGRQRNGALHVQQCLGQGLLEDVAALIDHNERAAPDSLFVNQVMPPRVRPPTHNDHLDIFAFSSRLNQCVILEAKRENEEIAGHQAILLAFIAYSIAKRRSTPCLNAHLGFMRFGSAQRVAPACSVVFLPLNS